MPSGKYLMEDFHDAGGLRVVLSELLKAGLLCGEAVTVSGAPLAVDVANAPCWRPEVIRPCTDPLQQPGSGTAVLHGSMCPDGAIIKVSAASAHLLQHHGRALVFDSIEAYLREADREDLDVKSSDVLIVRNSGPRGYPGMPEVGNLPLPIAMLRKGITDMVRISDARMSGTAYGTVILHVTPEAAIGGPLAVVRTGDVVDLDVPGRRLDVMLDAAEMTRRLAAWQPPATTSQRGWVGLYTRHVLQADKGCDLDFLVGSSGHEVPRESH